MRSLYWCCIRHTWFVHLTQNALKLTANEAMTGIKVVCESTFAAVGHAVPWRACCPAPQPSRFTLYLYNTMRIWTREFGWKV